MTFRPLLRLGHAMPLEVDRECVRCGLSPHFPHGSLFVNVLQDLYTQCANPGCLNSHIRKPLPCFLKHRDYSLQTMTMDVNVEEGLILKEAERQIKGSAIQVLEPDFDNRRYDPVLQEGPYQDCIGDLTWDDGPRGETWLRCMKCTATYHVTFLVTRGIMPVGVSAYTHFNEYRWECDVFSGKPMRIIPKPPEVRRNVKGIEPSVLMVIDQCKFEGRHIVEAVKG